LAAHLIAVVLVTQKRIQLSDREAVMKDSTSPGGNISTDMRIRFSGNPSTTPDADPLLGRFRVWDITNIFFISYWKGF
jgi:hypothetical protein